MTDTHQLVRTMSLGLRFLIELAALAALAVWGAQATSSTPLNVVLAILAPAVAIAIWGVWSAPRAPRRLHGQQLVTVEVSMLVVVAVLLTAAGHGILAAILIAVALVNGAMLRRE